MKPPPRLLLLALGAVLAFGSGSATAEEEDPIYVCRDADGDVVYQTNPCDPPVAPPPSIPEPNSEPAKALVAPSPKPPALPQPETPAPPQPSGPAPTPPAQATSSPARTTSWTMIPRVRIAPPARQRTLAKQTFPTRLAGTTPPASPSFESPEQTWRTFLAAIDAGDRASAAACLTPAALEKVGSSADALPMDELRGMVDSFTSIEDEGDVGVFWSIYGVRADQRPKWIFFEEVVAGDWKIAGI